VVVAAARLRAPRQGSVRAEVVGLQGRTAVVVAAGGHSFSASLRVASQPNGEALRALPFHVMETGDGVVLKRGSTEVKISGAGVAGVVAELVEAARNGAARYTLCERFAEEDVPVINELLDSLLASRLFVTDPSEQSQRDAESPLDVWYWQFNKTRAEGVLGIDNAGLVLVGLNAISRQLANSLKAGGARLPQFVHDARLMSVELARSLTSEGNEVAPSADWLERDAWLTAERHGPTCIVATSEFGNLRALRDWNRVCVERSFQFLPVFLQNSVGYIGPHVLPGETACFDCVYTRWNAGLAPGEARQASNELPPEAQRVVGLHPAMPSLLGDLAALELTRIFGQGLPFRKVGTQLEMNLLMPSLTSRHILKVPRCQTCSPLNTRAGASARR
jgi:bacteriocin biosynthesis cyclodehydratase domain-containing protein